MRLLVLGGTRFLGRAAVEAALARGHEVTLFNRGETNAELFPETEKLRGDRDGGLTALEGREWDAVIDPSGFVPRLIRDSAELLRNSVGHYVFVSSMSVYLEPYVADFDEDAAVFEDEPKTEEVLEEYAQLKAACERVLAEVLPEAHASVRAGLIVGPHDPSGRFTYWPLRVAAGGDVLAPGPPERKVQFVDVRDLAAWMLHVLEQNVVGVYNATGFAGRVSMAELLCACKCATSNPATLTWASEEFLAENMVKPWSEMPLWIPREGRSVVANARAIEKGMQFRPIADTVRDTLSWAKTERGDKPWRTGIPAEREKELLGKWREAAKAVTKEPAGR